MSDLGRFIRVQEIRDTWANEARDFTPWLADQIHLLSEALGLGNEGLSVQDTEVPVGAYFADIVCTDMTQKAEETVLVENQFGRSDHDHFGKLLTYASGLKASTVVLICEKLREEHRTAMTWLNSISNDDHRFFAVELELWRIDDSPIAPRFNVVVAPDDWARMTERTKTADAKGELSNLQKLYLRYWSGLREYITTKSGLVDDVPLRPRKPLPQHWTGFSIGRSNLELNAAVNSQARWIKVELALYGPRSREWRDMLLEQRTDIEAQLGFSLEWEDLDGASQRIAVYERNHDPTDEQQWHDQHAWFYSKLRDFYSAFHERVKRLP